MRGEKRNIIIKRVEVKKEGLGELKKVEGIVKATEAVVKIKRIKRIGRRGEGREIKWVRFASVGEKLEVMKGKKLRDRKEWIMDDLTEKEGRIE